MSVNKLSRTQGNVSNTATTWVRPNDWLTIPDIPVGTQKMYGLVAISPDNNNYVTLLVSGAFTVDWGDGTAPVNFASGAKAEKNIQWANALAGTLTSEGFRQVLVTVTPQASNTLGSIRFDQLPTGVVGTFISAWREIVIRAPQLGGLNVSTTSAMNGLRWFTFLGGSVLTTLNVAFQGCRWLRGITGTQWTSSVTIFQSSFDSCNSLESMPLLDTSLATTFLNAFANCFNLKSIPLFNTSNVAVFQGMFNACYKLASVPLLDTSKATNFNSVFTSCVSLQTVPLFNTSLVTDMFSLFNGCSSLTSVPLFDTSKVTNFSAMFQSCSQLKNVPFFVTTAGINFNLMFSGCTSLQTIPALDVSNGTDFGTMFQNCLALETLPTLNTAKGTNFASFANGATALRNLDIDVTNMPLGGSNAIFSGPAIRSLLLRGMKIAPTSNWRGAGLMLSAQALNDLYTSLGTATGTQNLIVSSNPGSGSSNTAIATAKGWTVTGG